MRITSAARQEEEAARATHLNKDEDSDRIGDSADGYGVRFRLDE